MLPLPQIYAGELNYIVPFMCAVLTAKLVGDMMTPSIYDAHAKLNGTLALEHAQSVQGRSIAIPQLL